VLAEASLALVLSHRESFSLACLEASQCGLPVIATRCGGPEEIVDDGETGLMCDVGDIAGIATSMERLLYNPAAAAEMGARGATLVRQRFSQETFAAMLQKLLFPNA
jgi:glycosyltransferase involved in cell wall biosynthesis